MRVFWVIVALLVAIGVGIPVVRAVQDRARAATVAKEAAIRETEALARLERERAAAEAAPKLTTPEVKQTPTPVPAPAVKPTPEPLPTPAAETPIVSQEPAATPETRPEDAPAKSSEPAAEPFKPSAPPPQPQPQPPPQTTPQPAPQAPPQPVTEPPAQPAAEPTPATAVAPAPVAKPEAAETAPSETNAKPAADGALPKIDKRPDGTMLVDDKFVVKGEGTKDKPYEVSWDMLLSAQETYEPRQGRKRLPERLTMLDGKFLKITGYVAYPMFVDQPRELLAMLNQWDGCCIGVPPTPYDAVEVQLAEPATKEQRAGIYGIVSGKFSVKPYLAGDWLVGLYLMENAGFESKGFGGS